MINFAIQVRDERTLADLALLERAGRDLTPAMRAIAQALAHETERNFSAGGRPRWTPLKNPPERRQGGAILQDSGQLAASITTDYGTSFALIGSNKEYAAIHQFGGKTKAHTIRPVKGQALAFGGVVVRQVQHPGSNIPARPFLPVTADGSLQPEAREEVLDTVLWYLKSAAFGGG